MKRKRTEARSSKLKGMHGVRAGRRFLAAQLDIAWEDKAKNFKRVRTLLDRAKCPPGLWWFLPEMFATGFSMNVARDRGSGLMGRRSDS